MNNNLQQVRHASTAWFAAMAGSVALADKALAKIRMSLSDISQAKPPIITYDIDNSCWRLWSAYNAAMTEGTFTELHADGEMFRVTWHSDGTVSRSPLMLPR